MSQKTLEKAVSKAIRNKWGDVYTDSIKYHEDGAGFPITSVLVQTNREAREFVVRENFIFAPDFAQALWGNEWEAHLQQMVISNNVMKYIEKNI